MSLLDNILKARGLTERDRELFLSPRYDAKHDPFLLPDMDKAVDRLVQAHERQEKIMIYGDYDIDGLTATTVLFDAFEQFGYKHVDAFIPNRFVEGYGLTTDAIDEIAKNGAQLIVTVDCGSLSEKEIIHANTLGIDVIVTDHHNVAPVQPPAVAVVNPKRTGHDYPFIDLAGVGVAFKLVQALQTRLSGLSLGQEKWLLDLVALGTVCDIVSLKDENRANVYWGLQVMAKTRRPGLKALMAVANVMPEALNARSLGFGLGPRMNAAGRLETAKYSLDMLRAANAHDALEKAELLDRMNRERRAAQDDIFAAACLQAEEYIDYPVLVVSHKDWNHGIVGIVAAKLLEKYKKPTFVLQEMGDETKGSARSYGEFSAADAIRASDDIITKGGGHKLAAGVTLPTKHIGAFRERVNEYYRSLELKDQLAYLLPREDIELETLSEVTTEAVEELAQMEPFGSGNPEPIVKMTGVVVTAVRTMGAQGQHCKLEVQDATGARLWMLMFNAPPEIVRPVGATVDVWFSPTINEWQGRKSPEGRLLHLE